MGSFVWDRIIAVMKGDNLTNKIWRMSNAHPPNLHYLGAYGQEILGFQSSNIPDGFCFQIQACKT